MEIHYIWKYIKIETDLFVIIIYNITVFAVYIVYIYNIAIFYIPNPTQYLYLPNYLTNHY